MRVREIAITDDGQKQMALTDDGLRAIQTIMDEV
jgi:hypothetical protein